MRAGSGAATLGGRGSARGVSDRLLATALVLVALAVAFGSSAAQAAPKIGERIAVIACPYRGVVATCLMINGADGTVFNINSASPRPRLMSRVVWLRGTVTDKVSMCSQGVVLDRIRWTRLPKRCPN
jgi:hypothetical protein